MFENLFSESGFSLDRCRSFLEVADAGGITQASGGSASRQSQLSRQLGELESWLGAKLVVRGRGRFALTESGTRLKALLHQHFSGLVRLRADCAGGVQVVRVGAGESLQQWLTVPALAKARASFPGAQWHLHNLRSEEVVSGLLDGELEMGILRRTDVSKGLRAKQIGKMTYALFVPVSLQSLVENPKSTGKLPLATLEGQSHTDSFLSGLPSSLMNRWERHIVCTSLPQAAEAVRLGLAAAVLPEVIARIWPANVARSIQLSPRESPSVGLELVWNPATVKLWPSFSVCCDWFHASLATCLRT